MHDLDILIIGFRTSKLDSVNRTSEGGKYRFQQRVLYLGGTHYTFRCPREALNTGFASIVCFDLPNFDRGLELLEYKAPKKHALSEAFHDQSYSHFSCETVITKRDFSSLFYPSHTRLDSIPHSYSLV